MTFAIITLNIMLFVLMTIVLTKKVFSTKQLELTSLTQTFFKVWEREKAVDIHTVRTTDVRTKVLDEKFLTPNLILKKLLEKKSDYNLLKLKLLEQLARAKVITTVS